MNKLTQCCCCISLRAGTLIIATLYMISTLFSIGVLATAIAFRFDLPEVNSTPFLEVFPVYYIFSGLSLQPGVAVVYLFMHSCVQFIIDIVLIIGAAKRKSSLVVPWLVLNILSLISNVLGVTVFCVGGFPNSPTFPYFGFITPLAVALFYLVVGIYALDVVNSFCESIMHRYTRISA